MEQLSTHNANISHANDASESSRHAETDFARLQNVEELARMAQEAMRHLAAISETSGDAIIVKNLDNIVQSWSKGAERTYGYSSSEMVGQPISRLLPPERSDEADTIIARIKQGERIENWETERITRHGRRIEVSLSVSPIRDESGKVTGALTVVQDITARREAQRAALEAQRIAENLESENRERSLLLETANRVALDILASRTGVEALRHIAEAARTLTGARYAAMGVFDSGGNCFRELIMAGSPDEHSEWEESLPGPRAEAPGVLQMLLERVAPLRLDVSHGGKIETFLGVPIRAPQQTLGAFYITQKEGGRSFSCADEAAVQTLARHAAVAIHHLGLVEQQHELMNGLITAQEEERRAIAYDLHDGLTQFIMASHMHMEEFTHARQYDNAERADRELQLGLQLLQEAVIESRRLVSGLRALALDDLGLAGALEQLLREEKQRAGWTHAEFNCDIGDQRFARDLETGVFRIAQESLTNARKYAHSQRVTLDLKIQDDRLHLQVRDWGCGFEVGVERERRRRGVGLRGMAERAYLLGGYCEVESFIGEGTFVRAALPIKRIE